MKIRSSLVCNRVVGDSLSGLVYGSLDHLNVEEAANSLLNPSLSDVDLVSAFSVVDPFPFFWGSAMSDEQGFESTPSVRSASSQSLSEQSLMSSVGDSTNSARSQKPTLVQNLNVDGIPATPVTRDSINSDAKIPVPPAKVISDGVEDAVKSGGVGEKLSASEIPTNTEGYDAVIPPADDAVVVDTVGSRELKDVCSSAKRGGDSDVSPSEIATNSKGGDADVPPVEEAVVDETVDSRVLKAAGSDAERSRAEVVSIHFHFF